MINFGSVSVIVPTIGRPDSLRRMLCSLCLQTEKVGEVIVADGSATDETAGVVSDACWQEAGLTVKRVAVHPPNAVLQRQAAIAAAAGEFLLLLDDDVVLETDCVEEMILLLSRDTGTVGVFADFNNQSWPMPTHGWRFYLRHVLRMEESSWQGRVVGPLMRFAYNPPPKEPTPMDWLGTCNSMIRRSAYEQAGGFSDFFLHRCTMNEDVDLGIKLARIGRILFCPAARMAHHHAPGGRLSVSMAAEDDLFNRFMVIHKTMRRSMASSLLLILCFLSVESLSNVLGACKRMRLGPTLHLLVGRLRGLIQVARFCCRLRSRSVSEPLR